MRAFLMISGAFMIIITMLAHLNLDRVVNKTRRIYLQDRLDGFMGIACVLFVLGMSLSSWQWYFMVGFFYAITWFVADKLTAESVTEDDTFPTVFAVVVRFACWPFGVYNSFRVHPYIPVEIETK